MFQRSLIPVLGLFLVSLTSPILSIDQATAMPNLSSPHGNEKIIQGKVIETMNARGYTYMMLSVNDQQVWVAIPETAVQKGDIVNYKDGVVMENFTSDTLGETFKTIIFSNGLSDKAPGTVSEAAMGDDSFEAALRSEQQGTMKKPTAISPQQMSGGSTGAVVPFEEHSVEKSTAPNGYTIEEIFSKAEDLSGQKVQVRAKIVKFSPQIMGRNWVHLQDGTGNPMQNTHDLVVTTNETADVGSVVVFEGILSADKDFGAGYKYQAIIEQAATIK